MSALEQLLMSAQAACSHARDARVARHVLAQLTCLGTHTVTGLLTASSCQHRDWSADYRLYERNRVAPERLFAAVRRALCRQDHGDIVTAMDDTRLRKCGRKVHGVKYMRDPLGPPFQCNLMLAQRFVQTSMALRSADGGARMIPVDFEHAPLPKKPPKNAGEDALAHYKRSLKQARLGRVGAQRLQHTRQWLDENGAENRRLWSMVDGSYTNGAFLKAIPHNTTVVGRIRSDAKLYHLPQQQPQGQGRKRSYGAQSPTPEQLRNDAEHPWKPITAMLGGKMRTLYVKELAPLRWRTAGGDKNFKLIVIRPTKYRLTTHGKELYRNPAYLLCSDPDAPAQKIVQYYLWRWGIEVNFRDQKTTLGLGQAQVRTPNAVQNVTATSVAAYALLLTAAAQCKEHGYDIEHVPKEKWRKKSQTPKPATTSTLIRNLRYELWAEAIYFSGFKALNAKNTKPEKLEQPPYSPLFYAANTA